MRSNSTAGCARVRLRRWGLRGRVLVGAGLLALAGPPTAADAGTAAPGAATGSTATGSSAAVLATANLGKTAGTCALAPTRNSLGGRQFESSCSGGYTGGPEYWCADFAQWVWQHAGLSTEGLSPEAASFVAYGEANGTQHTRTGYQPKPGDAVEFGSTEDSGRIDHVAIVTAVGGDGSVVTANGDWAGPPGDDVSMAAYAVRSKVVSITIPASQRAVGSEPSMVDTKDGYYVAGYTTPLVTGRAIDPNVLAAEGCGDDLTQSGPTRACPEPARRSTDRLR